MAHDSEDELDDFFRRKDAVRMPSESVPPPSKRRKSSHCSSSSEASEDDDDDASDASSELEIVGGPSSKKKAAVKGKSRAKETTTAGRRGKATLAAPRPLETGKKATKLLSVDSSSPESSPQRGVRSATQMLEGGDALEAMARQLGGWKGEGRPPRTKPVDKAAAASTSESPEAARTSKRQTSASTGATSLSDKSSSAAKAKSKPKASPRTTKKAPATKKKTRAPSSSPPIELEPEYVEQPPPPESFWGVKEALPGQSATKKKHIHGEASKRLQEMSKLPALRPPDDDDDDIASSAEGSSEEDGPPKKYETVAAKAKRERQEALAAQKAKREAKAKAAAAAAPPKPASKPAAAQPNIIASFQKKSCPVCNSAVPAAELEEHTQQCIAAFESQTQSQLDVDPPPPKPQPKPPPLPPPAPAPIKKAPPPPRSPSPKRPITNRASSHDGYIESSQAQIIEQEENQEKNLAEVLFPPSPSPKRISAAAKGKGRAVVQEEPEQEQEDYDMAGDENWPHDEEDYYEGGGDGGEDEEFDYDEDGGGEIWEDPADFAKLHGTTREVIEIGSDDDETVQVAAKARLGGGGAVNTSRAKGPPKDGSPPPMGSIYISTMSHAMRTGYAQMYRERSPKKGAASSTDPLAPQKMTAAPAKTAWRGKARRGGWGRGRGRGARRGARGRK
ncbi:hypothetical protein BCR35DRAFT_355589 [Leucosporidium creatinivorum]|uniref:UBZ4-type domain-containing protein n=1 Tax=Leucosporidium creatinivorum TaxID=106004 RepID=A0A1Y2DB94_9BASI|nr:hypothetical protein BCR35DRAFT_355589 [Leucosporidium creatinivorum]